MWSRIVSTSYFEPAPGSICGAPEQLARAIPCTRAELDQFLAEASSLEFADVRQVDEHRIEISSRRMVRDQKDRESERAAATERKRRSRGNPAATDSDGSVTPRVTPNVTEDVGPAVLHRVQSQSSESNPQSHLTEVMFDRVSKLDAGKYSASFETAWAEYPKRDGGNPKAGAWRAWCATVKRVGHGAEA